MIKNLRDRLLRWLTRANVLFSFGALALLVTIGGVLTAASATVSRQRPTPPVYVYFFRGGYDFAKLDIRSQEILARWVLPQVTGAKDWVPPFTQPDWTVERWQYDASTGIAYGLFPDRVYEPDALVQYAVVAFELPSLRGVRRFGPFPAREGVEIRVAGEGGKLLLSYTPPQTRSGESSAQIGADAVYRRGLIDVFNTKTGMRELHVPGARFFKGADVLPSGTLIYDGQLLDRWQLSFHDNRVVRERITGETFLSDEIRAVVERQAGLAAGGFGQIQTFLGDPAGGRIPVVIGKSLWDHTGILVFDLQSRTLVSPLIPP
jgi:hypothetical protein